MEEAPKNPRHFFYQPTGESTRALTGFNPGGDADSRPDSRQLEFSAESTLETQEPYFDDEDGPPSAVEIRPPTKMMPMSVLTGGDYEYEAGGRDDRRTQQRACFAAIVSVCFLIIGYWITRGNQAQNSHGTAGKYDTSGGSALHPHEPIPSECARQGLDATYFSYLLDRVQNNNQSELCSDDFAMHHECKCNSPFVPLASDKNWIKVLKMNIDLMKKNFTDRGFQPEVVIYGDSFTEHLNGRNFGVTNDAYAPYAKVTQELMSKRSGGHINGLPMGIAADEIAHLLYRLQNGEMPENLQPLVWWMLIGANDIERGCSVETVVAGNIRIVKEIRERHNNQHGHKSLTPVVINSILPRGKFDLYDQLSAYRIIQRVNEQLYCYVQLTEGVYFVNVTDIVAETTANGTSLKEEYFLGDGYHLSAEGSRAWEEVIVSNVMQLMA